MEKQVLLNPRLVVERLQRAMNERDVDAFVDCFDPLYYAEQPVHPERAFRGRERIRQDWSNTFEHVPDFKAEIIRCSADRDAVWTEWRWRGTRKESKGKLDLRGVTILGVREDRFIWGRLFMEPVQEPGAGIDAVAY